MHRQSPITHPVILEKSTDTRNWQLNSELLFNASTFAFFIYWLKKGADSVWSFAGLRYFFAPLAAIGSVAAAIFSIRQAVLKQDTHSISSAVIEVLATAATIVGAIAVIGSIAALAFIGPVILTAGIALKTLFSLGSAVGFIIHSMVEKNQAMKTVYRTKAGEALIDGVIGAIITATAVTLLFVASPVIQTVMASIAVAAAALTIVHYVVKAAKNTDRSKAEAEGLREKEFAENSDNTINNALGVTVEDRFSSLQQDTSTPLLPSNGPSSNSSNTNVVSADKSTRRDENLEQADGYRP